MSYVSNSDGSAFKVYGKNNNTERNKKIEQVLAFMEKVYINPKIEGFVDSIREFYNEKKFLTDKQYEALLNIYERI